MSNVKKFEGFVCYFVNFLEKIVRIITFSYTMANAGQWDSIQPPLSDGVLKTLTDMGFTTMTPVQANTLPLFLKNS